MHVHNIILYLHLSFHRSTYHLLQSYDVACIRRQEKENRQKRTLVKNHLLLREKLDVDAILPHLDANELLTVDDRDLLMNITRIQSEKINYLIHVLPKKSYGWFDKFLDCLDKSTCGTGHVDIKQALSITYDILSEEDYTDYKLPNI